MAKKGVFFTATCSLASILVSSRTAGSILLLRQHHRYAATSIRLFSAAAASNGDYYHVKHNDDRSTLESLAKNRKTLKRLGPMVDLATSTATTTTASCIKIAADIGCDHGLLTYGLAATGHFDSVVGVDVSQLALEQGAFSLLQASQQDREKDNNAADDGNTTTTKISFLIGNGLEPLLQQDTELSAVAVDTVCVAGMGVHTMVEILNAKHLKHISCQRIVVQPTNSRPRHMMMLYQHLLQQNFVVEREYMVFLSRRWYLNTSFRRKNSQAERLPLVEDDRNDDNFVVLPGQMLESYSSTSSTSTTSSTINQHEEQRRLYQTYVDHHLEWLRRDQELTGHPPKDEEDRQWLESILNRRTKKQ